MKKSKPTTTGERNLYILGLKKRGEADYGLTTWMGDKTIFYAIYDCNPGYWKNSIDIKPVARVQSEKEAEKRTDWIYIGFGWEALL